MIARVVASQRHREVKAQADVGQRAPVGDRAFKLFAALENLKHQLLVVATLAAGQSIEIF